MACLVLARASPLRSQAGPCWASLAGAHAIRRPGRADARGLLSEKVPSPPAGKMVSSGCCQLHISVYVQSGAEQGAGL